MAKKATTISISNTPVQRALARAKRSSLIILFVLGIAAGFVYKTFFSQQPTDIKAVEVTPPAAPAERP